MPPLPALPDFVDALGDGLCAIDTGFQRPCFDAAYLIVANGRAAFVDTGTNHSVPRLLATLDALGLARDAVDHVIATHVHLDHVGGVGLLMQQLPRATLVVHPRGARHLIDPTALYRGALAVCGQEEMDQSYGALLGVDASRVVQTHDDMVIELAGRPLRFADTPGHARHHHCIWDESSRGWFTGDTFGLSYREFDNASGQAYVLPTSTPTQFDPDELRRSVQRLMQREPEAMYLTHFSRVREVPRLAELLLEQLEAMVEIGMRLRNAPNRHEALKAALSELYVARVKAHGSRLDAEQACSLLALDIELNARGLAVWLDRP